MGQVRWAGWTVAVATALVISGLQSAQADVASDKPAAIVVYPKIIVDGGRGIDTVIRLTNTNPTTPIEAHCFYIDANSHCSGGLGAGQVCEDASTCGGGVCVPGWNETDFRIILTAGQPIQWEASDGLPGPDGGVPIPTGVCTGNQFFTCGVDADCTPFPGGVCTQSNAGTRIPPTAEDPFKGELKCIAVDANGTPVARNELKGEALIETVVTGTEANFDVASYNAIGVQATGAAGSAITDSPLTLGPGSSGDYNGCPNILILNHFFDDAADPVPGGTSDITTDLTLVPCTEDFLRQVGGSAVVQYLVFNEFEQRFSTSRGVNCFQEIPLCNIDTPQCSRSLWNVNVAGTLSGQTRLSPLGSGLLGVAIETHTPSSGRARSAAFNLHFSGSRDNADLITLP
ncbi:MAG: hypothetical protein ACHQ9S_03950 [Candidatus Binatia bacterium]